MMRACRALSRASRERFQRITPLLLRDAYAFAPQRAGVFAGALRSEAGVLPMQVTAGRRKKYEALLQIATNPAMRVMLLMLLRHRRCRFPPRRQAMAQAVIAAHPFARTKCASAWRYLQRADKMQRCAARER